MARGKSAWLQEAVKFYHEKRRSNPNYKYKDALKELGRMKRTGKHHKEHTPTRKARKSRRRR